ncbi:MAG: AbrB/MazE/SpoVT family DNA-binding domain-containing protein [Dehalococcoidia bacterium]
MTAAVKHDAGGEAQARTTKVSRKNQITLPVAALRAAHVKPGDLLRVEVVEDGVFRLVRYRDPRLDLLNELAGSAPGLSAATNLEELRDEWQR